MVGASGTGSASRVRSVLLAACAFTFALLLWDVIADLKLSGEIGWDNVGAFPIATVTYLKPGLPAIRGGLRVGDKVNGAVGSIADRVRALRWIAGVPQTLAVQRGNRYLYVRVVPIAAEMDSSFWLTVALCAWATGFATIVALRGIGRRAQLLTWLILLNVLNGVIGSGLLSGGELGFYSPWPWVTATITLFVSSIVGGLAIASLAIVATTFARPVSSLRNVLTIAAYIAAAIAAVFSMAQGLRIITPWVDWVSMSAAALTALNSIAVLLAAACAVAALTSVRRAEWQKAAWLLVPLISAWLIGLLWSVAFSGSSGAFWHIRDLLIASSITSFLLTVALTYAVLRRRLLDVDFVINRAAVFAAVSVIVVGVFVAVESLLNRVFIESGRMTSVVVTAIVALTLGMSLRFIHRYVDRAVDQLFFRRRHERERSLRTFAHEVGYITDYDLLLDELVREVSANADTDNVSILIRGSYGTYATVRCKNGKMLSISENDRAILKMRAWHTAIDLEEVHTHLEGAWAYPLMSCGDVLGVLVCGAKRDGQGYAPDESDALYSLAQGVGSALGAFSARNEDLKSDFRELKAVMYKIYDALRATPGEQPDIPNRNAYLADQR
jgi:hypothetical protein